MAEPTPDTADMVDASLGAVVGPQGASSPEAAPAGEPAAPDAGQPAAEAASEMPTPRPPQPEPPTPPKPPSAAPPGPGSARNDLPSYTRSLLKIAVPVTVTLAEKRQPLGRIVELSPGAIIQFDKSCEEMLDLSVAGHNIAAGEAVKVGDKFGLKITSVVLPAERFEAVRATRRS